MRRDHLEQTNALVFRNGFDEGSIRIGDPVA
jgi:hypothetical protein